MIGAVRRIWAVMMKEVTQMRRDRLTFAMMFGVPIMQLMLFGFAINMDPKNLPAAVVAEEATPVVRSIVHAMDQSGYYDFILQTDDPRESETLLATGKVAFVVTFPSGFTEKLIRGERPALLIEADATDPAAASGAIGSAQALVDRAIAREFTGSLSHLQRGPPSVDLRIHRKYNPEGRTQFNIVPGLLGVILTMTLVMITAMAMTREVEQGTMENLLAMPAKPLEVMFGKIFPYVGVGAAQVFVILMAARFLFAVPFVGDLYILIIGVAVFMLANLALGFTFSTLAQSQMQAMQLTFFFFLPSILLSGFMFPFRGMPIWAQYIGEALPLTHFLRIVRGVMLKGAELSDLRFEMLAMAAFTCVAIIIAMSRYRRTLD